MDPEQLEREADDAFDGAIEDADEEMDTAIDAAQKKTSSALVKALALTAAGEVVWFGLDDVLGTLQKLTAPLGKQLEQSLRDGGAKVGRVSMTTLWDAYGARSSRLEHTPADLRAEKAAIIRRAQASLVPVYEASARRYADGLAVQLAQLIGDNVAAGVPVSATIRKVAGALETTVATKGDAAAALAEGMAGRYREKAQVYVLTELASARGVQQQEAIKALSDVDPDVRKEWVTYPGCCADCSRMQGEEARVDEMFSNGLDAPPQHPNCKCSIRATHAGWRSVKEDSDE